jgi:hypothetical protein
MLHCGVEMSKIESSWSALSWDGMKQAFPRSKNYLDVVTLVKRTSCGTPAGFRLRLWLGLKLGLGDLAVCPNML